MNRPDIAITRTSDQVFTTNKVITNTYMLLAATLIFSGITAVISMFLNMPMWTYIASVLGAMVLGIFVLPKTAQSSKGIGVIFLITGMMGFGLGSVINYYLSMPNGPSVVSMSLAGTGVIFLGLSGYALSSKRDFSFLGGFVFAGMMVLMLAVVASIFMNIPALQLAIAAGFIMLMAAYILFQTSQMINGGETNYIMATYGLYIAIFNIFISLLQILGFLSGDD